MKMQSKKVLENMMNMADVKRRGRLFFKIMMNIITSNIEEAIYTLTSYHLLSRSHPSKEKTSTKQSVSYTEQTLRYF